MPNSSPNARRDFAGTAFFSKTYSEALELVDAACSYMEGPYKNHRKELPDDTLLQVTAATTRMTARLTQVMAWLYMQQAVHRGEMTIERVEADHRLGPRDICLPDAEKPVETMPQDLQPLIDRSLSLYVRVARLDDMLAKQQADGDLPAN